MSIWSIDTDTTVQQDNPISQAVYSTLQAHRQGRFQPEAHAPIWAILELREIPEADRYQKEGTPDVDYSRYEWRILWVNTDLSETDQSPGSILVHWGEDILERIGTPGLIKELYEELLPPGVWHRELKLIFIDSDWYKPHPPKTREELRAIITRTTGRDPEQQE